jgi:para-nitrobenzyl esterase
MKKTLLLLGFVSLNAFSFAQCGQRYHDKIFQDSTVSNVTYGSNINRINQNETLRLDIHFPKGDVETARPLVIIAHGGNFLGGSKTGTDVLPMAKDLARMGYVVSSIDYRVGMTNFPLPGPDASDATEAVMRAVHDARAAVRFFRASYETGNPYRIDTSKIFFAGVSAGGFMALHLAYLDEMSEYPTQVDTVGQYGLNGGIQGLSGNPGYSSSVRAIINIAGAIGDTAWMKPGDIPVLNFHGTNDQTVPYGSDTIRLLGIYPLLMVHGSFSVDHKADLLGITNCFEIYEGQNHVPHVSNASYYDTTLNITRNFLAHFVCNEALNCSYGPQITAVAETYVDLLNAFPNPANEAFELILEGFSGNVNITLVDLNGKVVRDFYCSGNKTRITRDGLPAGMYLVRAANSSKSAYTRVIFH